MRLRGPERVDRARRHDGAEQACAAVERQRKRDGGWVGEAGAAEFGGEIGEEGELPHHLQAGGCQQEQDGGPRDHLAP
jgi:hypothetical protein